MASITYGYDPNGNLTSKTTTGTDRCGDNTYTYDDANRLTSWDNGTTTTAYGYDGDGNRTQVGDGDLHLRRPRRADLRRHEHLRYTARGTLAGTTGGTGRPRPRPTPTGSRPPTAPVLRLDALGRVTDRHPVSRRPREAVVQRRVSAVASDGS